MGESECVKVHRQRINEFPTYRKAAEFLKSRSEWERNHHEIVKTKTNPERRTVYCLVLKTGKQQRR